MLTNDDKTEVRQIVKEEIKKELKPVYKRFNGIEEKLNTFDGYFKSILRIMRGNDSDMNRLEKRAMYIEKHLQLSPTLE